MKESLTQLLVHLDASPHARRRLDVARSIAQTHGAAVTALYAVTPALLVAGTSVTDIASRLKLSVKTVSTHKANLMQKLGLGNQSELVRYALRHGLADELEP